MACLQPAYHYFISHFVDGGWQETVQLFQSAHPFSSRQVSEIQPTNQELHYQLRQFGFLDGACIDVSQRELPTNSAAAKDVNPDIDVIS